MRKLVAVIAGLLIAILLFFNGLWPNYRTKSQRPGVLHWEIRGNEIAGWVYRDRGAPSLGVSLHARLAVKSST
jgi:hypothetical protein